MLILILFYAQISHAQQMSVWAKDPMSARDSFKGQNVQWDDAQSESEDNAADGHLEPGKRDALFTRIGFNPYVAHMDEMSKDLLVMTAHTSPIADLKMFYPKIKPDDLTRLKVAVDAAVAK